MRDAELRPFVPLRFERPVVVRAAEVVLAEITALVTDRQALRAAGAPTARLEQNRIQIARAQWELSHALIQRHRPPAQAA
jgi:hypothetical protein